MPAIDGQSTSFVHRYWRTANRPKTSPNSSFGISFRYDYEHIRLTSIYIYIYVHPYGDPLVCVCICVCIFVVGFRKP